MRKDGISKETGLHNTGRALTVTAYRGTRSPAAAYGTLQSWRTVVIDSRERCRCLLSFCLLRINPIQLYLVLSTWGRDIIEDVKSMHKLPFKQENIIWDYYEWHKGREAVFYCRKWKSSIPISVVLVPMTRSPLLTETFSMLEAGILFTQAPNTRSASQIISQCDSFKWLVSAFNAT